jgi:arylsulfatase A-like enzyme
MSQPNVLFVLSDQHNAKVLGHQGHPDVRTPHLDRMAAEGVRFENAISQNPICTPSRMCFLSGQYCHNHGYYGLSGPNPGGLPSVVGHFRRAPGRFRAGHVAREIVESVDVAGTLSTLAGLEPPATVDGLDLSPLLQGQQGGGHRVGVTEFAWSKSLRKGDWRYVFYPRDMFPQEYPDGFGELYNLADDPWEMRNLYFDPAHRAKAEELKAELLDWLVSTARPVSVHGVNSNPWGLPAPAGPSAERYGIWTHRDGRIGPREIRQRAGGNYV